MTKFNIKNQVSGVVFGTYDADTKEEALELFAKDAGYASYAEACEVTQGAVAVDVEQADEE